MYFVCVCVKLSSVTSSVFSFVLSPVAPGAMMTNCCSFELLSAQRSHSSHRKQALCCAFQHPTPTSR